MYFIHVRAQYSVDPAPPPNPIVFFWRTDFKWTNDSYGQPFFLIAKSKGKKQKRTEKHKSVKVALGFRF